MPKRKLNESHGEETITHGLPDGVVRRQQQRLESVIEHGNGRLIRALKIARGIERQKLGRRQKTASQSNASQETIRLDAEVSALKVSDSIDEIL